MLARLLFSIVLLGACAPATRAGDAIAGLVVTRTVTVAGNDFCQFFLAAWRDKPGADQYTLALQERPSARWGSDLFIDAGQRRLLHLRLPTRRALLRQAAEEAADAAWNAVVQQDLQRQLAREPDLGPDEL